jgi:hypothetical protein
MIDFIYRETDLTPDPILNFSADGCAEYDQTVEQNWETSYVTKYNEDQAFGVDIKDIKWSSETFQEYTQEKEALTTPFCDYTINNNLGKANFTTEAVGDATVEITMPKQYGKNKKCIWFFSS